MLVSSQAYPEADDGEEDFEEDAVDSVLGERHGHDAEEGRRSAQGDRRADLAQGIGNPQLYGSSGILFYVAR